MIPVNKLENTKQIKFLIICKSYKYHSKLFRKLKLGVWIILQWIIVHCKHHKMVKWTGAHIYILLKSIHNKK